MSVHVAVAYSSIGGRHFLEIVPRAVSAATDVKPGDALFDDRILISELHCKRGKNFKR